MKKPPQSSRSKCRRSTEKRIALSSATSPAASAKIVVRTSSSSGSVVRDAGAGEPERNSGERGAEQGDQDDLVTEEAAESRAAVGIRGMAHPPVIGTIGRSP